MVFWLKHFKVICPHGISPFPWIKVRRQNFSRHVWASQTSISHHHSKAEPQGPLSAVPSRLTASWGHIHQLGKGENHSPGRSVARAWGGNAAAAAKLLQSCLTLCDPRDLQKAHSFYSDISWWSITGVIFFYIQICLLNRWNRCLNANGCPLLSCSLLALLFLGYTKHLCSFTFLFATGFLSKKWNLLGIF